jgi:hypothetical protein
MKVIKGSIFYALGLSAFMWCLIIFAIMKVIG